MSAVTVGSVVLWTPIRIRVGTKTFMTSLDTITQRGSASLTKLFSDPSPIFDEVNGLFMVPEKLCADPAVFELLLDYLRTGSWLPIQDRRQNEDVSRLAATLGLPEMPPPVMSLGASKYEYVEVALDHRPSLKDKLKQRRRLLEQIESGRLAGGGDGGGDGSGPSSVSATDHELNSCASLVALADRGYRVVGERIGSKLQTGDNGGISALPTTVVSLQRKHLAALPLISQLAVVSPWFLTLSQCL